MAKERIILTLTSVARHLKIKIRGVVRAEMLRRRIGRLNGNGRNGATHRKRVLFDELMSVFSEGSIISASGLGGPYMTQGEAGITQAWAGNPWYDPWGEDDIIFGSEINQAAFFGFLDRILNLPAKSEDIVFEVLFSDLDGLEIYDEDYKESIKEGEVSLDTFLEKILERIKREYGQRDIEERAREGLTRLKKILTSPFPENSKFLLRYRASKDEKGHKYLSLDFLVKKD